MGDASNITTTTTKQNHHARGPTPLRAPHLEDCLHHGLGAPCDTQVSSRQQHLLSSLSALNSPVKGTTQIRPPEMSRKGGKAKLDLKLRTRGGPSTRPAVDDEDDEVSPPSSCVSSDEEQRLTNSPEATSMLLAGCPRCLMYVMLSEEDPKCPKCKSTVLLDFQQGSSGNKSKSRKS